MKSYILCLAAFVVVVFCEPVVNPEFLKKVAVLAKDCQIKTGATDADVETILKHQAATTRQAKCFHACALEALGLMDANGKWSMKAAVEYLNNTTKNDQKNWQLGKQVYEHCANIPVEKDHCLAAEQYAACIHKRAHEVGFILAKFR